MMLIVFLAMAVSGQTQFYSAWCSGTQAGLPAITAYGNGFIARNVATNELTVDLAYSGVTSAATAIRLQGAGNAVRETLTAPTGRTSRMATQTITAAAATIVDLDAGALYFIITTTANANGELRCNVPATPSSTAATGLAATVTARYVPIKSCSSGSAVIVANISATNDAVTFPAFDFSGLRQPASIVGVHGPSSQCHAPHAGHADDTLINFAGVPTTTSGVVPSTTLSVTSQLANAFRAGQIFAQFHQSLTDDYDVQILGFFMPEHGQLTPRTCTQCALTTYYSAWCSGTNAGLPAVTAYGNAFISRDTSSDSLTVDVAYAGMSSAVTAVRLQGSSGAVHATLTANTARFNQLTTQTVTPTSVTLDDLEAGNLYAVVVTSNNANGEIRCNFPANSTSSAAATFTATANSRYIPEGTCSQGTSTALANISATNDLLTIPSFTFAGLRKPVLLVDIHGPETQCHAAHAGHEAEEFLEFTNVPATTSGTIAGTSMAVTSRQANAFRAGQFNLIFHDTHDHEDDEIQILGFFVPNSAQSQFTPRTCDACAGSSSAGVSTAAVSSVFASLAVALVVTLASFSL